MRFLLLQQVGGDCWMVYDSGTGDVIKTYGGKHAKSLAVELCELLNRGVANGTTSVTFDASLPMVRSALRGKQE